MANVTCSVDGCDNTNKMSRGWCDKHYTRWRVHGDPTYTERILGDDEARFWSKVEKANDCWLWLGSQTSWGYGQFRYDSSPGMAHRYSYRLRHGSLPDGLQLDHLCRVRHCVNPDHLEAVTQTENILRGTSPTADNAAKTHCHRGHELTEDNIYRRKDRTGRDCRSCKRLLRARA